MKFLLFVLALLGVPALGSAAKMPAMTMPVPAAPGHQRQTPASLSGAFVAAVPPVSRQTAAYFTLKNTGKTTLTLTGVSSAVAGESMLMTFRRDKAGLLGMKMVAGFSVKPGQSLTLSPSGDHVMLGALKRPLKVGERLTLKLSFSDGSVLSVAAPVQRF